MELIITPAGVVHAIYGEVIPLETLGPPRITRASRVEPDAKGQWWADLGLCGGPQLGPYPRRSDALQAEVAWLKTYWLSPSPQSPHSFPRHIITTPLVQGGFMMVSPPSRQSGCWILLLVCTLLLLGCDEDEKERVRQAQAQRQAQYQAQLAAEQAQRAQAELAARAAQESRVTWITTLGAGACAVSVVMLLVGIHIGTRAVERHRKEHPHG